MSYICTMIKLITNKEQKIFVSSDFHYSHTNIVRGVTRWRNDYGEIDNDAVRDFDTLEEMNERLVLNINSTVGENDILFHLGDWSFGGEDNISLFRNRLHCKNIHNIFGNHDHHIKRKEYLQKNFISVHDYLHLQIDDFNFILQHYPIASWDGIRKEYIHLYGHVHTKNNFKLGPGKCIDVGVDGHLEFRPYNIITEIVPIMENQPIDSYINQKFAGRL